MPRKLTLLRASTFGLLLFSSLAFAKGKGVFSADITPSTTKHGDPNEVVTFTGSLTSQRDFDFVNVEWKFEGDVEVVSGPVKTIVNDVRADQPQTAEISVRIKSIPGSKIIFWVYKDVDGARLGQTQIYTPQAFSIEVQSMKIKEKPYRIKSKRIIH